MKKVSTSFFAVLLLVSMATAGRSQTSYVPQALQTYIETALSQNPDVMASRARWKNTDARVAEARSGLIPHLDFVSRFTQYSGGRVLTIPSIGTFNATGLGIVPWDNKFEFVWPIGNYALWQGASVASALRDASTAEVSAKELSITYSVTEAYYNYAKASELVKIRMNADTLASENLRMAQALYSNDKAPKNDVLRAEVGVAAAEGDVLIAKNMAALARTNFNNLLKREYDSDINLPKAEDVLAMASSGSDMATNGGGVFNGNLPSFNDDYDRAFNNRPELQQLRYSADAAEGVKKATLADYLPNISLFASYGWQENSLKFSGDADLLLGGVQFQWNFFSGFGTNAKMNEQEAQIEELRYQTESATNGIRLELESARLDKVNAIDRLAIARKQVTSAEENYKIVKAQYDNGLAPLITLIDAETALSNSKANLTTTTYDVLIANARYKKALGIR